MNNNNSHNAIYWYILKDKDIHLNTKETSRVAKFCNLYHSHNGDFYKLFDTLKDFGKHSDYTISRIVCAYKKIYEDNDMESVPIASNRNELSQCTFDDLLGVASRLNKIQSDINDLVKNWKSGVYETRKPGCKRKYTKTSVYWELSSKLGRKNAIRATRICNVIDHIKESFNTNPDYLPTYLLDALFDACDEFKGVKNSD